MPQRDQHTVSPADPQATTDQEWQWLVEQRVPADLEDQARQLKGFWRGGGPPPAPFLVWRALFFFVPPPPLSGGGGGGPVYRPSPERHFWSGLAQNLLS